MSSDSEMAHAIAGAGGGALSMIVTYPLVTLSTLSQTAEIKKGEKDGETTDWRSFFRKKRIRGLYSGLESALYGITLSNFIYYYFYELTANAFLRAKTAARGSKRQKGLTTVESMVTGAVAGAITVIGTNPFWVANTRLMARANAQDGESRSAIRIMVDIANSDGVSALFSGVIPALVLVINPIIQYTILEQFRNVIVAAGGPGAFTSARAFLIGAFGKLVATTITYPYIVLKSRKHLKRKDASSVDETQVRSMLQDIRKIIAEEGFEGLYRGLSVKLFQSIMTAAFLFYFKEELMTGSVKLVQILQGRRLRSSILKK